MNDSQIIFYAENVLAAGHCADFTLQYVRPVTQGRAHVIAIESSAYVAEICIWQTGYVDWNIFDRLSPVHFAGHAQISSVEELKPIVESVLTHVRQLTRNGGDGTGVR